MTYELPSQWERVTEEQFSHLFRDLWKGLTGQFRKVEIQQEYLEPDDLGYQAFKNGDMLTAERELRSRVVSQKSLYTDIAKRGVHFTRLRYCVEPYGEYLKYEMISYPISATFGEKILLCIDKDLGEEEKKSSFFRDFMMFDNRFVLIPYKDGDGTPAGGFFSQSTHDLECFMSLFEEMEKISVPLGCAIFND